MVELPIEVASQLLTTAEAVAGTIKKCSSICQTLRQLATYGKHIPYVGFILVTIEGMLPVDEAKKGPCLLEKLGEKIKDVKDDIRKLENTIKWETMKLQFCDTVKKIETGIKYLSIILNSTDDQRTRSEERLIELCSNQAMTQAVTTLLSGLTGDGFLQSDILETIYLNTRGHRKRIEVMYIQFLELLAGGLAVIAAFEKLKRDDKAALEMIELFKDDAEKVKTRFDSIQQKCKDHFSENMLADLKEVLAGDESDKDAAASLSKSLRDKYDWLETYCVIFNANNCIDYNFSGHCVKSKEHNGRFGIIFHKDGIEDPALRKFQKFGPRQARRLNEVVKLIKETDNDCGSSDAAKINRILRMSLTKNGFSMWGCATAKVKGKISSCFEISGTWTKAVPHVGDPGGHEYLCLLK